MNGSTESQSRQGHNIKTLVMFDTETTGVGNNSRIIELCFVALLKDELLSNYKDVRVMNKLLLCFNPHRRLAPCCSRITGLHNDALEAYGSFKSNADLISSFLKGLPQPACLIAHNGVGFDFPLLISHFKRAKEELPQDILCVDSLEAFRELDGLPRIPDFVLKRKQKSSPQKAINTDSTVGDIKLDECSDMTREQESPRKQPRLSSCELNGWKIEEKTPENKKYTFNALEGQHSKRVLLFSDPESLFPSNGESSDCTTNGLLKVLECECVQVCHCNSEPLACTETAENVKNIEKKKVSYSLPNIYQRMFGQAPAESHTAESDCITLLKIIRCKKDKFYQWCNRNAVHLSTIDS